MMFSKACENGIRALTVLGKQGSDGKPMRVKEICKVSNTPEPFTAKILQNLVKKRIIKSAKGPNGGFYIDKQTADINLYDIVEAIDGTQLFTKCGLGLSACNASKPCPLHNKFEVLRDDLMKMCKSSNLDDLVNGLSPNSYRE